MSHVNLNDGVCEGLRVLDAPAFSVQHHPEAGPGPHDSAYLFEDFAAMLGVTARREAPDGYPLAERGVGLMPRRDDIESILLIGAGPIVIGQACEFDYSGTQACKVLGQEGYRVILANSNPATIMTDPEFADGHLRGAAGRRRALPHHRPGASRRGAPHPRRARRRSTSPCSSSSGARSPRPARPS